MAPRKCISTYELKTLDFISRSDLTSSLLARLHLIHLSLRDHFAQIVRVTLGETNSQHISSAVFYKERER